MFRVLVCGGRKYRDAARMHAELLEIWIDVLIEGEAPGADTLSREYADRYRIPVDPYPAKWRLHGRTKAGPIRNAQMLAEGKPNLVVAFPGGTGTANMMRQARAAGVEVKEIK